LLAMKTLREWRGKVYKVNQHDDFYETPEWRKTRRAVLHRDHYLCIRCDKRFKSDRLTAHHVIPRAEGGIDDSSNVVTLCSPCHDIVEIGGFKTKADIIGSYEAPIKEEKPKYEKPQSLSAIDEKRPDWHKYVYGGMKRR